MQNILTVKLLRNINNSECIPRVLLSGPFWTTCTGELQEHFLLEGITHRPCSVTFGLYCFIAPINVGNKCLFVDTGSNSFLHACLVL